MALVSQKDEQFRSYALNASPLKVVLSTCAPLALFQALQSIFKIFDALLASHISADAVSAVAVLSQITLMITALGTGLAVGGSIKISEAYGRGDYDAVRRRVATVYAMAVAVSILVAAVLIPFAEPFLRLLQTPEALIAAGTGYFRIEILTLVINFFNTVYIAIAWSRGHAKKILMLNMVIVLVKLGCSALFVYGMNGGVTMIAVATLISQVLMLLYALWSMHRDEGAFRFSTASISLEKETVLPILRLSYPVSGEKLLLAAGKVIVNSMAGVYGSMTAGALGISNNIGGLTTSWHMGFTDGAAPLISQNRGAGKYRRTLHIYFWLLAVDIAIGVAGLVIVTNILPWLARIFAQSKNNFDQTFCDMIVAIHQWEMLGYITLGINSATLALLLGTLEDAGALGKTILYSLNPADNGVIGTIMGGFQTDSPIPGKIQQGSAWWFNDHKPGMEAQMVSLMSLGAMGSFNGMLTDSRSFLSYTRHEYFRRILCNLFGQMVEDGEYPADMKSLGRMVENISYNNTLHYFRFDELLK